MRTIILSLFLIPFFLFAAEVKSYDFVVAKDGTGNFTTIQDAIDAVPDFRKKETKIYIKNGTYREKIILPGSKRFVTLVGEDRFKTIISYDDYAQKKNRFGEEMGTSGSASFYCYGDDFTAINLSFENLVRPWRPYAKVIFMHCNLPKFIEDKGWHNWGKESNEKTAYFAEYKNKGAGSMSQNRVKWSRLLTDREADGLSFQRVFKDWVPNLTFDR